ncbi:hypothetical protein GF312_10780 [Candidatus Poribacteria bacterium]|nr:hypothetical protein [Candidatus Poribacteria bacterium]
MQRLYLRHFTMDEIQIARREMNKGRPSPSSNVMNEEEKELNTEAMRRLRESGWAPAGSD